MNMGVFTELELLIPQSGGEGVCATLLTEHIQLLPIKTLSLSQVWMGNYKYSIGRKCIWKNISFGTDVYKRVWEWGSTRVFFFFNVKATHTSS